MIGKDKITKARNGLLKNNYANKSIVQTDFIVY